jgi:hypothetical protein
VGYIKRGIILFTISILSFSQVFSQDSLKQKSFFKKLWGSPIESSIIFLPYATHTYSGDFFGNWYTGGSYKGFEAAFFLNSHRNWCVTLLYKRAWKITKRFSVDYAFGALYGYKGRLHNIRKIGITNNFLFAGPVNPIAGLELDYKISKKFAFRIDIIPLVIMYGFRYII